MYAGCRNFKTLKVSVAILNSIREETGSQWNFWSTGEIWSDRLADGILCEQGNSEPLRGDLWETLTLNRSGVYIYNYTSTTKQTNSYPRYDI